MARAAARLQQRFQGLSRGAPGRGGQREGVVFRQTPPCNAHGTGGARGHALSARDAAQGGVDADDRLVVQHLDVAGHTDLGAQPTHFTELRVD